MLGDELVENLVTWVYEEGSYVPVAKIQNGERYTIISDYMGRPVEAYSLLISVAEPWAITFP